MRQKYAFPTLGDDTPSEPDTSSSSQAPPSDPGMGSSFDFAPSADLAPPRKKYVFPGQEDEANQPTYATAAMAPAVGANRALAEAAGTPVDLVNSAIGSLSYFIPGRDKPLSAEAPVFGSEFNKKSLGLIGANPDEHPPRSDFEKYLQAAGQGVAGAVLPEMAAAPIVSRASKVLPPLFTSPAAAGRLRALNTPGAELFASTFGAGRSTAATATNALVGGVGSMTGEGAAELVPEKYKGVARSLGSMAGAVPVAGTATVARMGKDYIAPKVGQFFEPMSEAGQLTAAKRQFQDLAANRAESQDRLQDAVDVAGPGQPVTDASGARLSTAQIAGDTKLLGVERSVAGNSEEFKRNQYGTGDEQQNQARGRTVENIQPNGSPTSVSGFLNGELAQIDAQHQAAVNTATAEAQRQRSGIGQGQTPEAVGNRLRNHLDDAQRASEAHEDALWRAIDPEGRLALTANRVEQEARNIRGSNQPADKPIDGEERAILDYAAENLGPVTPFNNMVALRKRINAEMRRTEYSDPVSNGRLSQLQNVVTDSINNAAEHQAAQEQAAVARGEMTPEQTMEARVRQWRDSHYARQAALENNRVDTTGIAGAGPTGAAGVSGTAGEAGSGLRGNAGNEGVPPQPLVHNFDDAAAERLAAANAATREQKQIFGQGPVAKVLATKGTRDNYRLNEELVPDELLKPGPRGHAAAGAYRRAVNGDPVAMQAFNDAAAESLRREAMPNGEFDINAYNSWAERNADMIRTLPPALRQRFQNAANAQQAVEDAAAARLQAQDAYREGIVGRVMGVSDPHDVTKTISSIFNQSDAVQQMTRLRTALNNDPDAVAGLRRSVLDSLLGKTSTNKEVGLSGIDGINLTAYKKLLNEKRAVLRAAGFSDPEINTLQAVASSMETAQHRNAVQAQPRAAAALLKHLKEQGGPKETLINKLADAKFMDRPLIIAKHLVNKMRDAGLTSIQQMQLRGLQDPEFGLELMQPIPKVPGAGSDITFGKLLTRMSQFSAQKYYRPIPDVPEEAPPLTVPVPTRASGGRVNTRDYPAKKASALEKQANRIRKAYGGELNPLLHMDDNVVARALRLAHH